MYSILQPGSTVATALSMGESKPKHVFMLEIGGRKWRKVHFPLETVRPFVFENVVLKGQADVDAQHPESVDAFLAAKIERLMTTATLGDTLPLIRLRVDYSGMRSRVIVVLLLVSLSCWHACQYTLLFPVIIL